MPDELLNKDLEKSYWLLTHFESMRSIFLRAGIGIDIFIGLIALIFIILGVLPLLSSKNDVTVLRSALTHPAPILPVQDVVITQSGALVGESGTADLYAHVTNPNADWRVSGTLVFTIDGKDYMENILLYPSQSRYIIRLSVNMKDTPQLFTVFKHASWKRMTREDRRMMTVPEQIRAIEPIFSKETEYPSPTPRLSLTIRNESAYSFWQVDVPIVVLSGGSVIALERVKISRLLVGESRPLNLQWHHAFDASRATTFDVHPFVDVLDSSSFIRSPR